MDFDSLNKIAKRLELDLKERPTTLGSTGVLAKHPLALDFQWLCTSARDQWFDVAAAMRLGHRNKRIGKAQLREISECIIELEKVGKLSLLPGMGSDDSMIIAYMKIQVLIEPVVADKLLCREWIWSDAEEAAKSMGEDVPSTPKMGITPMVLVDSCLARFEKLGLKLNITPSKK